MYRTKILATAIAVALIPAAYAAECSLSKANHDCTFTLDRRNPLAPPTIQMYPGSKLTVVVSNPYPFERYFLDYSTGQIAIVPDVTSSLVSGLLPSIKNVQFALNKAPVLTCSAADIQNQRVPLKPEDIPGANQVYRGCLNYLAETATALYRRLEPVVAPDSHPQSSSSLPSDDELRKLSGCEIGSASNAKDSSSLLSNDELRKLSACIRAFYDLQVALSLAIKQAAKLDIIVPLPDPDKPSGASAARQSNASGQQQSGPPSAPPGKQNLNPEQANDVRTWVAANAALDAVAADLFGFGARISSYLDAPGPSTDVTLQTIPDPNPKNTMVTRQVTYAVDAWNLVQLPAQTIPDPAKKRTLANVTILFADSRWDASAGVFFSTLANRSFALSPVISNATVINQAVIETKLHPTVVPFAAANVRLGRDFTVGGWRSAVYWTFALGINPNSTTTEFGIGPSFAWRALMLSALWHVGRDVRLTQGLYSGQILDANFPGDVTTEHYWRFDRVALGISVRIPSLTGR